VAAAEHQKFVELLQRVSRGQHTSVDFEHLSMLWNDFVAAEELKLLAELKRDCDADIWQPRYFRKIPPQLQRYYERVQTNAEVRAALRPRREQVGELFSMLRQSSSVAAASVQTGQKSTEPAAVSTGFANMVAVPPKMLLSANLQRSASASGLIAADDSALSDSVPLQQFEQQPSAVISKHQSKKTLSSGIIQYPADRQIARAATAKADDFRQRMLSGARRPKCCTTCGHFRDFGNFSQLHGHKTCSVSAPDFAPKHFQFDGWCECPNCSQFATAELKAQILLRNPKHRFRPRHPAHEVAKSKVDFEAAVALSSLNPISKIQHSVPENSVNAGGRGKCDHVSGASDMVVQPHQSQAVSVVPAAASPEFAHQSSPHQADALPIAVSRDQQHPSSSSPPEALSTAPLVSSSKLSTLSLNVECLLQLKSHSKSGSKSASAQPKPGSVSDGGSDLPVSVQKSSGSEHSVTNCLRVDSDSSSESKDDSDVEVIKDVRSQISCLFCNF
jgi:hypothetical protein